MSGYPGANRPHGGRHQMPQANPGYDGGYQGYAPPPGPPQGYGPPQGFPQPQYQQPPYPPQQYQQHQQQQSPYPQQQQSPYHQQGYASPSNFPQPSFSQPSGPPPTHYGGAMPASNVPQQYQGGQFAAHTQPQGHQSQYSNCTGRRKMLSIGINYTGTSNALAGCHNDTKNICRFMQERYGFAKEDTVMLMDTPNAGGRERPTRANMITAMQWLVRDARPNDSLFFHFSGHGGQSQDVTGDEEDGTDETIYPLDFKQAGMIVDDDLHDILVKPLPAGCRLTAIFDSCHSGTALDLPYVYSTQGKLKGPNLLADAGSGAMTAVKSYMRGDLGGVFSSLAGVGKKVLGGNDSEEVRKQTKTSPADCIQWSGCKDSQTSADTSEAGKATGAMSYAFITALTKYPQQTYMQLLNTIRDELRDKYDQRPQLSCSHELDCNLVAIM